MSDTNLLSLQLPRLADWGPPWGSAPCIKVEVAVSCISLPTSSGPVASSTCSLVHCSRANQIVEGALALLVGRYRLVPILAVVGVRNSKVIRHRADFAHEHRVLVLCPRGCI